MDTQNKKEKMLEKELFSKIKEEYIDLNLEQTNIDETNHLKSIISEHIFEIFEAYFYKPISSTLFCIDVLSIFKNVPIFIMYVLKKPKEVQENILEQLSFFFNIDTHSLEICFTNMPIDLIDLSAISSEQNGEYIRCFGRINSIDEKKTKFFFEYCYCPICAKKIYSIKKNFYYPGVESRLNFCNCISDLNIPKNQKIRLYSSFRLNAYTTIEKKENEYTQISVRHELKHQMFEVNDFVEIGGIQMQKYTDADKRNKIFEIIAHEIIIKNEKEFIEKKIFKTPIPTTQKELLKVCDSFFEKIFYLRQEKLAAILSLLTSKIQFKQNLDAKINTLIVGEPGKGKCISKYSKIELTKGSFVEIGLFDALFQKNQKEIFVEFPCISYNFEKKEKEKDKILKIYKTYVSEALVIHIKQISITTSVDHRFWVLQDQKLNELKASSLRIGQLLFLGSEGIFEKIKKIELKKYADWMYDLHVEKNSNYYANSILVHNSAMIENLKKKDTSSLYGTGELTTNAGLISSVSSTNKKKNFSFESGLLLQLKNNTLVLDELDKMEKKNQEVLGLGLSSKRISFSKATLHTDVLLNGTLLCFANPHLMNKFPLEKKLFFSFTIITFIINKPLHKILDNFFSDTPKEEKEELNFSFFEYVFKKKINITPSEGTLISKEIYELFFLNPNVPSVLKEDATSQICKILRVSFALSLLKNEPTFFLGNIKYAIDLCFNYFVSKIGAEKREEKENILKKMYLFEKKDLDGFDPYTTTYENILELRTKNDTKN